MVSIIIQDLNNLILGLNMKQLDHMNWKTRDYLKKSIDLCKSTSLKVKI